MLRGKLYKKFSSNCKSFFQSGYCSVQDDSLDVEVFVVAVGISTAPTYALSLSFSSLSHLSVKRLIVANSLGDPCLVNQNNLHFTINFYRHGASSESIPRFDILCLPSRAIEHIFGVLECIIGLEGCEQCFNERFVEGIRQDSFQAEPSPVVQFIDAETTTPPGLSDWWSLGSPTVPAQLGGSRWEMRPVDERPWVERICDWELVLVPLCSSWILRWRWLVISCLIVDTSCRREADRR